MNSVTAKLCLIGALLMPLGLWTTEASAQKVTVSEKYFKGAAVVELEIELGMKEQEDLRLDPHQYVKATLKEGTKIYKDVGIHLKGGAGSFRPLDDKPSLTLNMNKFKKGQTFHGMDKYHLVNSIQDPSYMNEFLSGELFRAAGVPAARVMFATVTLNGKKRGLYYLREGFDKFFLKQNFGTENGNLYDAGTLREVDKPLE